LNAKVATPLERAQYVIHCQRELKAQDDFVRKHGLLVLSDKDNAEFRLMSRFVSETANVLLLDAPAICTQPVSRRDRAADGGSPGKSAISLPGVTLQTANVLNKVALSVQVNMKADLRETLAAADYKHIAHMHVFPCCSPSRMRRSGRRGTGCASHLPEEQSRRNFGSRLHDGRNMGLGRLEESAVPSPASSELV
jgi:hypothetical protein